MRRSLFPFLLILAACGGNDNTIPTFKVEPVQFSRRVIADGNLKSTKATPVTAPTSAPGVLKVAWIASDGDVVKKDDVIVRFDPTEFQSQLLDGSEMRNTASNKVQKTNTTASATKTNL